MTDAIKQGPHAAQPKWAALIDDVVVPVPQRQVKEAVLRAQGAIPDGFVLVRDHNSPHDVVLREGELVDLAAGNVFYRLAACDVSPKPACTTAPKLAYFVDDRPEITTNPGQTGQMLRDLFSIPRHMKLFRDLESPNDTVLEPTDAARFVEGPVFYTRRVESRLQITVNQQLFGESDGVKARMSGAEIAGLVFPENPADTIIRWQSNGDREVAVSEIIDIVGCEVFSVTRRQVVGGYENARVDRELEILIAGGARISQVKAPLAAVIYHGLPTKAGSTVASTDVMVLVPSGYPGAMIDGAHLPAGSALIGRVAGQAQGQVSLGGQQWQLISYHPHNGGGAPPWNPQKHGFHTYLGELLSWLYNTK